LADAAPALSQRVLDALADRAPFTALAALLEALAGLPTDGWRSLAKALIEEGERFSHTPAGARWCELLGSSQFVQNGWLLWNQMNADFYVRNAPPLAEDPIALLHDALRQIARADLESLVNQLSDATMSIDAQLHAMRSGTGPHEATGGPTAGP
jgi:hypothetical protein